MGDYAHGFGPCGSGECRSLVPLSPFAGITDSCARSPRYNNLACPTTPNPSHFQDLGLFVLIAPVSALLLSVETRLLLDRQSRFESLAPSTSKSAFSLFFFRPSTRSDCVSTPLFSAFPFDFFARRLQGLAPLSVPSSPSDRLPFASTFDPPRHPSFVNSTILTTPICQFSRLANVICIGGPGAPRALRNPSNRTQGLILPRRRSPILKSFGKSLKRVFSSPPTSDAPSLIASSYQFNEGSYSDLSNNYQAGTPPHDSRP